MDWLDIYNKYKDIKEVYDFIADVQKLRGYYATKQYAQMQRHIHDLTRKYPLETYLWNSLSSALPQTYEQAYQNAEAFLQSVGAKILVEKCTDNNH